MDHLPKFYVDHDILLLESAVCMWADSRMVRWCNYSSIVEILLSSFGGNGVNHLNSTRNIRMIECHGKKNYG